MFVFLRLDLCHCRFEHLTDFIIVRLARDLAEQFPVRMILHLSENYVFDRVDFHCLVGKSVGSHHGILQSLGSATFAAQSGPLPRALTTRTRIVSCLRVCSGNSRNFYETVVSVICRAKFIELSPPLSTAGNSLS